MKQDIHPTYHTDVLVTCACGNTFVTGSVTPEIKIEICSNCHPFFTGEQKFVDTEGKVDRFIRLQEQAKKTKTHVSKRKAKKKGIVAQSDRAPQTRSLKQMIDEMRKNG